MPIATNDEMVKESLHEISVRNLSGYRILKELLDIMDKNGIDALMED